jgi:hypothetical protein
MTTASTPSPLRRLLPLSVLWLAACGGGGGGATNPGPMPPPPTVDANDTQSLPAARLLFDIGRTTAFLSSDVQNIIVLAPSLVSRGDRTESCEQGGSLKTTVVRPDGHPDGPLVRQQFSDCRTGGLWLRGTTETTYTRRVTDAGDQPWAGSVRFIEYRIDSLSGVTRQRRYDGLATSEGALGVGGTAQARTLRLTNFTLEDSLSLLGRPGLIWTTSRFDLRRSPGALGDPLTLEGSWSQGGGTTAATTTLDAGSQLSLVENTGTESLRGRISWRDIEVRSFDARVEMRPASSRTAVRVLLDINEDGRTDRDVVLDRYGTAGIGL